MKGATHDIQAIHPKCNKTSRKTNNIFLCLPLYLPYTTDCMPCIPAVSEHDSPPERALFPVPQTYTYHTAVCGKWTPKRRPRDHQRRNISTDFSRCTPRMKSTNQKTQKNEPNTLLSVEEMSALCSRKKKKHTHTHIDPSITQQH